MILTRMEERINNKPHNQPEVVECHTLYFPEVSLLLLVISLKFRWKCVQCNFRKESVGYLHGTWYTADFHVTVVVQFYPWFKFHFPLCQTHYHTLTYPKTKENKIYTKDKIEPQYNHHKNGWKMIKMLKSRKLSKQGLF